MKLKQIVTLRRKKARIAFHKLIETYNLPNYTVDVINRETVQVIDFHLYKPASMYEVLAKVKFSDKNSNNLKSNFHMVAFLMVNKFEPIIDEKLEDFLGNEKLYGFGYKGEKYCCTVISKKVNESWFDLGCKMFIKNK